MSPGAKLEIRGTDDTGESYVEDILVCPVNTIIRMQNMDYHGIMNTISLLWVLYECSQVTILTAKIFFIIKNQATPTIKMTIDVMVNGIGETVL